MYLNGVLQVPGDAITETTPASGIFDFITAPVTNDQIYVVFQATSSSSGAVPVTNGGTGTTTQFTAGSVVYAGTSGIYNQDNSNFIYDATNHNLRIGPTSAAISTENKLSVIGNANDYHGPLVQNLSAGTTASTDIVVANDLGDANNYADFGVNSSGNTNASYTLFQANDVYLFTGPGSNINNINIATGSSGKVIKIGVGGTLTANEVARFTATGMTVGLAGTTLGRLAYAGNTSGTTTVQPAAAASGTLTLPAATDTLVGKATTDTLTNKRITKRVLPLSANSATPAINTDSYDVVHITSQTAAITSFTSSLTGTPVDGDTLRISVTGTGAVALTFGASFEASTVALPTTTSSTTRLDMGFLWNSETSKWRVVASA